MPVFPRVARHVRAAPGRVYGNLAALAQSSVFRGGFSLEAAEAVLALPGDAWVVDQIQALRDKSLVRTWPLEHAALAGELRLEALLPEIMKAYGRFFGDDPKKVDPQCWAKTALAKA